MLTHHRGVLAIDNDEDVRRTISRKLMTDGIRADIAQCADDAMRLLDQSKYEVVLTDWQLPDGDAGQIVSHLRESAETRPERVMIMTAAAPNVRKIDRTLVRGVLFKPLDYSALTAQVRAMLS